MKLSAMPPKVKIPAWVKTTDLYIPKRDGQDITSRPDDDLMRGLCPRSAGNLSICETCRGGCSFGAELLRREDARRNGQCPSAKKRKK